MINNVKLLPAEKKTMQKNRQLFNTQSIDWKHNYCN